MFVTSHRQRRSQAAGARPRRGVALVFVMVFVIAMAALAMSSIFMSSGATSLARSYDRERDLRFAAEAALAIGKARVNGKPSLLVMPADTIFRKILDASTILGADNRRLPGIKVNVYVGLTGSTSGQYGRFASIVAEAYDERTHAGFIRRLELTQESFAKFAYWSNQENNGSSTIYFGHKDILWGPVWSNDVISILDDSAVFNDQVSTAKTISGKQYGIFAKPPLEKQTPISLPSTAQLAILPTYAAAGGMTVNSVPAAANATSVLDRIEFVAFDVDGDKDSTGTDEGFYRWYQASAGNETRLRGNWPGGMDPTYGLPTSVPNPSAVDRCGDWHYMPKTGTETAPRLKFYPASVHGQTWFRNQILLGQQQKGIMPPGYTSYTTWADAENALGSGTGGAGPANTRAILSHPNARCWLAGDPHLVATDRPLNGARGLPLGGSYTNADIQKGGEDTTFTPQGWYGIWKPSLVVPDTVLKLRPWDARYLTPIGHALNINGKGVIHATGNVGISGVVNGLVTLYAKGDIVILDDVTYANDPALGVCHDILGLVTDFEVVVADNAINSPVGLVVDATQNYGFRSMDDNTDLVLHAVVMTLNTSFEVENYGKGATNVNGCDGTPNGRGCIMLSGGLIQQQRGTVGRSTGQGFTKRYTYDRCAVRTPPPYFPTTGRFADNRYLELDPVGFDAKAYFLSLSPSAP